MVVNHAPFPKGEENKPEEESSQPEGDVDQVCNGEEISQMSNENLENENGPLEDEEVGIEEVQVFHRPVKKYDLRDLPNKHPQAGGLFTTSIPPNNFTIPPNPNASNNPMYPHVPKKYLSKEGQAQVGTSKGKSADASKEKVVEYFREAPIDMSMEQLG